MSAIPEPPMDAVDWEDLRRGIARFNAGEFWHAHEAWEAVWRRKRAHPSHVFLKGLIQLAAAHHQRERGRHQGMLIHFERVRKKLAPYVPTFLGVDVHAVLAELDAGGQAMPRVVVDGMVLRDRSIAPRLSWSPPDTADD